MREVFYVCNNQAFKTIAEALDSQGSGVEIVRAVEANQREQKMLEGLANLTSEQRNAFFDLIKWMGKT